jgi:outer membrane protein assembly factor BamB
VANRVVYAGATHHLYAVNATTGAELWGFSTASGFGTSSPAVANGVVYVGGDDGNVYAFGLTGGSAAVRRPSAGELHPDYVLRPRGQA